MEVSWISWVIFGAILVLGIGGGIAYYLITNRKEKAIREDTKKAEETTRVQQQEEEKTEPIQEDVINLAPLVDYIKKGLAAGRSYQEIESALLNHGWKAGHIKQAFDDLGRENGDTATRIE